MLILQNFLELKLSNHITQITSQDTTRFKVFFSFYKYSFFFYISKPNIKFNILHFTFEIQYPYEYDHIIFVQKNIAILNLICKLNYLCNICM